MPYVKKSKVTRVCDLPSCGVEFETNIDKQRFHSTECRLKFVELVQMGRCPHCGKRLLSNG